jgi:hypothetical protein
MPTYTWTRTREQLGGMILRKLGVLGASDTAEAEDAALVYEAMDARLKELQTLHILWWNVTGAQTSLPLTAGVATATIGAADFLYPVTATVLVGNEERPLRVVSHREYQALPNKGDSGEPELLFIDGALCRFWPVPRSNTTANLTYQAISADVQSGAVPDVPPGAMRAFALLVAGDLVDEFGLSGEQAARLTARQTESMRTLRMIGQQRVDTAPVVAEYF